MKLIDLHCDTVMYFYKGQHLADMEDRHISRQKLLDGGVMAQCFAIFIPTGRSAAYQQVTDAPEVYFEKAYVRYLEEMEANQDVLRRAFCAADIQQNAEAGMVSSVLTVEDGVALDGRLQRLDDYYTKGVRMLALTWNNENSLGYPNSDDPAEHSRGLKPFGIDVVRRMNELGMIADVSHLSEGGFWDVANHSAKPFVASHSCARAVHDHRRNLTDAQLRAVADSGGVVGVNFLARFLYEYHTPEENVATIDDICRHLTHMKNVAGADALAIGSDYDGMGSRLEWKDCGGNQLLLRGLERAFTSDEIEKIAWKNALRVFQDVLEH